MRRTLMMTAAFICGGQMALAAIDPQAIADGLIADGYSFVEVKQGPTQTKIEAVKGTTVVETIYNNDTGDIIKQETEAADAEYLDRTGVDFKLTNKDFEDTDAEEDDEDEDEDEDEDDEDEDEDDDNDDDDNDNDDNSGHDGDNDDNDDDNDNSGSGGGDNDGGDDGDDD